MKDVLDACISVFLFIVSVGCGFLVFAVITSFVFRWMDKRNLP